MGLDKTGCVSLMNLKVRRDGEIVELRKVELDTLSPPLFRTLIGYNSLKRLGYSISFIRPKKSTSGDFERIRYNFIERGVMTRQLEGELEYNSNKRYSITDVSRH
jgi:hypothetical protein